MNKLLNKKTGIAAAVIAVIVIGAVVISTSFSSALTLDEAKEIAQKYVPASAKFVTSEEEDNKFEVMFRDEAAKEGFEVEVNKESKLVKKVESQLDDDLGSEKVDLKEDDVKKIIKEKFEGVNSVNVTLNKDNGLYEYEADFKAEDFYGNADVHPVSGEILDSTVKFGTAVTIPMNDKENSGSSDDLLTSKEVEKLVLEKSGGGFVKDMDLDKENGTYYYEVEVIKDNIEYDYYVNAVTGEIVKEYEHESYFDYDDDMPVQQPSGNSGNSGSSGNGTGNSSGAAGGNVSGNNSGAENSNLISEDKARNIVLAKIPGADIYKLNLEKDDGIYVYEGEARLGEYEYDFEINASSGVIISWEKDRIEYDDDDDEWDD